MNYYPFHIGDYFAHTSHLSPMEDLAYRRILDISYLQEKPLPAETQTVCRLVRLDSAPGGCEAVEQVLREFFELQEDGWHNKRVEHELWRMAVKVKTAQKNGKSGGRPRKTPVASSSKPNRKLPNTQYPIPKDKTPPNPPAQPDGFAAFWVAYPKKVGKGDAEKAFKAAKVNGSLQQILSAIEVQKKSEQWTKEGGRFIPNPATWLRQKRWEDELVEAGHTAHLFGDVNFDGVKNGKF